MPRKLYNIAEVALEIQKHQSLRQVLFDRRHAPFRKVYRMTKTVTSFYRETRNYNQKQQCVMEVTLQIITNKNALTDALRKYFGQIFS